MQHLYIWLLILGLGSAVSGIIHQDISAIANVDFDFIVVGGGTAGSVVASRLSENPNLQVLVIEAGPSNANVQDSMVPFNVFSLAGTRFDWNFTSTPQSGLNGRTLPYTRGHILGGSSSINSMFYTRGSSDDYNRFAQVTGDPGWSWDNIQSYIRKNERWTSPADQHDTSGQFDPSDHGFSGMTFVSLPGFSQEIDDMVIQTTKQLNHEFPFNLDMNSGKPLGLGWLQSTIGEGARSSAATSYLNLTVIQRQNLHILLETRVTRILPATNGTDLSFRTVELLSDSGAPVLVNASKEIILSAGTIGTPNILLHSGIGDKDELGRLGIASVIDLPDVGKNLTDQPVISINWATTSQNPFDGLLVNATLKATELAVWEQNRTGPMVTVGINHVAWLRLPSDSDILNQFPDPSAGQNTPHLELAIGSGMASFFPGHFVGVGGALVTPASRGTVQLGSNDVLAKPLIDPGMLNSTFDVMALRESIKSAKRFFAAPAWKGFVLGIAGPLANATTDQELESFIRGNVFPSGHIVGTAAMSPQGANHGVVDPDLRLKHASGLRVVDASVMPFVTCSHTQAPVYIIAERAVDLIKNDWNSP
ncbi:GMC oxidoreductase [Macrolepiota fuliginosa MF-IS2]|uniref:pyranose dehydrogenase (acceptor) n=1 Tax=Macrolepiota fuliginosa MF-IS2 TaxID=1400762 RepID=A0A9P5XI51_9AGAR|nr:GMC oxidoreductase [Macrolepiota fuliginosa MF-IS2]